MGMGRSQTLGILLDAVAVTDRAIHKTRGMLAAVDQSIALDMSDDDYWSATDEALSLALEFADDAPGSKRKTDLIAQLLKARHSLRDGMRIDFSDHSKEKLKALIMPEHTALELIRDRFRGIIALLEAHYGQ